MVVSLNRWDFFDEQTIGSLMMDGEIFCYTLELPWRENRKNISCIPIGDYEVRGVQVRSMGSISTY